MGMFPVPPKPRLPLPQLARWLAAHGAATWEHLGELEDLALLDGFVVQACAASHLSHITMGRYGVAAMPREWVLTELEGVAARVLDLSDDWEYRRLLEVYDMLDASEPLERLVALGAASDSADVREAAEDFRAPRS